MKYIIVRGNTNSGRHTTIKEVCRRMNPDKVFRINIDGQNVLRMHRLYEVNDMQRQTYLLEARGKKVLVLAGPPTEQDMNVSRLISVIKREGIPIDLAIVAVNTYEKRKGFSTGKELQSLGSYVTDVKVNFIPSHRYATTDEWHKRVTYLSSVTNHYL